MTEYIVKVENLAKLRKLAGLHVKETIELTSGKIVRCRDCMYYMDYEHEFEPNLGYCRFHDMEEVRDSRFCAWAKRKEGGE